MAKLSLKRSITDYAKVQSIIGYLIRGRSWFFRRKTAKNIGYLDIGCGSNTSKEFINLDYNWSPRIDVCIDITKKGLPFQNNSFQGVYSEHCLEHISYENFKGVIKEIFRILKPAGVLRLIMPDGELYLDIYQKRKSGENEKMPYEEGYISTMHRINGIFRNHGHQFIYDFYTVEILLIEAGFRDVKKEQFNSGRDQFLLKDDKDRAVESLYVEAMK